MKNWHLRRRVLVWMKNALILHVSQYNHLSMSFAFAWLKLDILKVSLAILQSLNNIVGLKYYANRSMAFEIGALGMSTFITCSVLTQQATKLFRIHKIWWRATAHKSSARGTHLAIIARELGNINPTTDPMEWRLFVSVLSNAVITFHLAFYIYWKPLWRISQSRRRQRFWSM